MVTAVPPTHLTPQERLNEVAEILAGGILRLLKRRAKQSAKTENICLDKPLDQWPYHVGNKEKTGGNP